jgi:hypothetical protein
MSRFLLVVAAVATISGCASRRPPAVSQPSVSPSPAAAVTTGSPQAAVRTAYVVTGYPDKVVPAPYGVEYFGAPRDSLRARCIQRGGVWRPTARECEIEAL